MSNITIFGAGNIGSAVAGIAVKAGATMQVIDRNPDKAAAAAAEGVTNQTPWTGGFKVVK